MYRCRPPIQAVLVTQSKLTYLLALPFREFRQPVKSKLLIPKAATELGRRTRARKKVTHESQQKRVAESLRYETVWVVVSKHMEGGIRRGDDRMVVVGGREVFDVSRNGGTECSANGNRKDGMPKITDGQPRWKMPLQDEGCPPQDERWLLKMKDAQDEPVVLLMPADGIDDGCAKKRLPSRFELRSLPFTFRAPLAPAITFKFPVARHRSPDMVLLFWRRLCWEALSAGLPALSGFDAELLMRLLQSESAATPTPSTFSVMPAKPSEMCENCGATRKDLRRCAGLYGDGLKTSAAPIGVVAAFSALNIVNHPKRIDNHILIIYVDFLGTAAKAPYTHDVVDAEVLSVNDLTRKVNPPDREPFLRLHTPLLGKIGVLLRDLRFPWSHPMNFLLPPADAVHRFGLDPSWFEHLHIAVTCAGQPIRPREAVERRSGSLAPAFDKYANLRDQSGARDMHPKGEEEKAIGNSASRGWLESWIYGPFPWLVP
ncbi:hypothetical protein B0H14DRAFT_2560522 [Mycena olivaceomarginata]|nr:hypothetical protein B0H14DRAFT_2560522 [Mycena olivaceomarginata]